MPGILVTGGAGFIGSHIVDELMTAGHEVLVVDDLSEGNRDNLRPWFGNDKFQFVQGDIRDLELMKRACDQKSVVFHLAGMSRIQPSISNPTLSWSNNVVGTGNVLEAARLAGVKRVVYSASSSSYGLLNNPPLRESMPSDCLNPYALSKRIGEEMCEMYRKLYGLSTVSLKYFNVYGPRHQESGSYATVIAIFRKQKRHGKPMTVVGDGEQQRDFTFVSDVVRANMLAMMNRDVHGTINIGTGVNYSINHVASMIQGDVEHISPRPAEARITLADVGKAREMLGWVPNVSLKEGLAIIDAYEKKFPPCGILIISVT